MLNRMLHKLSHWIAVAVALLMIATTACGIAYYDEVKSFADKYGNLAGVLGFVVSMIGFPLTVWTVFEAIRINAVAQAEIQKEIVSVREETKLLLSRIRLSSIGSICEQAFYYATEARNSIRSNLWHRAAERCHDARLLALDLLAYGELEAVESKTFRAVAEDLKTVVAFIERNRLKSQPTSGMPPDKIAPLDLLIDNLQIVRSRLKQNLLEYPHDN